MPHWRLKYREIPKPYNFVNGVIYLWAYLKDHQGVQIKTNWIKKMSKKMWRYDVNKNIEAMFWLLTCYVNILFYFICPGISLNIMYNIYSFFYF